MHLRKFLALMLSALIACSCMSVSASANKVSSALADEITPFYISLYKSQLRDLLRYCQQAYLLTITWLY